MTRIFNQQAVARFFRFQRRRPIFALLLTLMLMGACSGVGQSTGLVSEVVTTDVGVLEGQKTPDALVFSGVPYAAPPVGSRRWAAPQPLTPWAGTRDATRPASPCPQAKGEVADTVTNEDCLYLNITAPLGAASAQPKPVMVWLHGGGLVSGTANTYDPTRLAAQGDAVVVTVESRLNIFGYFALPGLGGSGTFGLQDEQAALGWIQRNISAFGGDPDNVTLFGQSGGAVRVCGHLTSPGSAGLFHKAILQSGGCSTSWPAEVLGPEAGSFFRPLADAQAAGAAVAAKLGCRDASPANILACLRALPAAQLLNESNAFGSAAYRTPVLPLEPRAALAQNRFSAVPVISGHTRDEARAIVSGDYLLGPPPTDAYYQGKVQRAFGEQAAEVESHYPLSDYPLAALRWAAIVTDRMFVCPQLEDAATLARHTPTFVYQFSDPHGVGLVPFPPELPSGASHSAELPLLFDLTNGAPFDLTTGQSIPLSDSQQALGRTMIGYWAQFAHAGDPNGAGLPRWSRAVTKAGQQPLSASLDLAPDQLQQVDAYALHQCAFWASFLRPSRSSGQGR